MQVQRTLVKSPPELWAEVSDVDALARHLDGLGEIRITRIVPETEVAWEGDAASGTVALDASGWGTKVTLTAELTAAVAVAEPVEWFEPEPEPEPLCEPKSEPVPEPVAVVEREPEPEPVAVVVREPEPEPVATIETEPEPVPPAALRQGRFARLFRRRAAAPVTPPTPKPTPAPHPVAVAPPTPPTPKPVAIDLPTPPAPAPDPVPPAPAPDPAPAPTPDPGPPPPPQPSPPQIAARPDLEAVLTGVLDDLGSAHHRPFSRS